VRKQGQIEVTVYVDGVFEHQQTIVSDVIQENNTLHVMDNRSRIAQARVGKPFSGDTTPAVKYHLGDHLGSSNVALDETGSWVNREEYTPYGETSFGSFATKRHRFTGKERDEESGLYYHRARYYAPWLARWVSCDPAGMVDGTNPYNYVRGNPIKLIDSTGLAGQSPPQTAEVTGVQALEAKYSRVGKVTNITPAKQINTPGVDAHLIVGQGEAAVNVIGDVKYSGQPRPRNVSEVSSFENALKDSGRQLRENIISARRSGLIDKATARSAYEGAKRGYEVLEDVVVVGSNKGVSVGLKARQVAITAVDTFAHVAEKVRSGRVGGVLSRGATTVGGAMFIFGVTASSMQVTSGAMRIAKGETALGAIDVTEGAANLSMSIGAPAAVKSGAIAAGGGAGALAAAGLAAGGSLALAAETARAAVRGEPTPIDVADKFYGTHFGDIHGWVTGVYAKR
jgi:RHS repeat-associated protein